MLSSAYQTPACKIVAADVLSKPLCMSDVSSFGHGGGYVFDDQYEGGMQ